MPHPYRAHHNRTISVKDSTGRQLEVSPPGWLRRLHLAEAVGPETARNDRYMGFARLVAAVIAIDGEPCEPIRTKRQLETRAERLDDHGLAAAQSALSHAEEAGAEQGAGPEALARQRLEDSDLLMRLALVRHGIPFHAAFELAPDEPFPLDASWALTFTVGLGMVSGATFDWKTGQWRRP